MELPNDTHLTMHHTSETSKRTSSLRIASNRNTQEAATKGLRLRRIQLLRIKAMHAARQKIACELSDLKRRIPVHRDSAADIPDVLPFATQGEVSSAVKQELDEFWV
jgi:hypothetical protein